MTTDTHLRFRGYTLRSYRLHDDLEAPEPRALLTAGCGCCGSDVPVTAENLAAALADAREWLAFLETLTPDNS